MRKNLVLTVWLALPILVFGGLLAWIFVSMSRPKLMDEAARGPGAGDTGGANALGEWLAGRSPNDVQRANTARRQGLSVDPFWWPGGVRVIVEATGAEAVSVGWIESEAGLLRSVALRRSGEGDGAWSVVLREHRPDDGAVLYVSAAGMRQRIREGRGEVIDDNGAALVARSVEPVAVGDTLASDAIVVRLPLP